MHFGIHYPTDISYFMKLLPTQTHHITASKIFQSPYFSVVTPYCSKFRVIARLNYLILFIVTDAILLFFDVLMCRVIKKSENARHLKFLAS